MKKLLALVLAAMMLCAAAALAEDAYASLGSFEMMVGHAQPEGNPRTISTDWFAAEVEARTNGHVHVTVFPAGQMGTEKEMLEQVVQGAMQGMRGCQCAVSPRLLSFTLPFMTNTRAEVTARL